MSNTSQFRAGFSADFLDDNGALCFPDIGLSLLDGVPDLAYEFLQHHEPEYFHQQLCNFDVLISFEATRHCEFVKGSEEADCKQTSHNFLLLRRASQPFRSNRLSLQSTSRWGREISRIVDECQC